MARRLGSAQEPGQESRLGEPDPTRSTAAAPETQPGRRRATRGRHSQAQRVGESQNLTPNQDQGPNLDQGQDRSLDEDRSWDQSQARQATASAPGWPEVPSDAPPVAASERRQPKHAGGRAAEPASLRWGLRTSDRRRPRHWARHRLRLLIHPRHRSSCFSRATAPDPSSARAPTSPRATAPDPSTARALLLLGPRRCSCADRAWWHLVRPAGTSARNAGWPLEIRERAVTWRARGR